MELTSNPKVATIFENYPKGVKEKMLHLRDLVLNTALETKGLEKLEETLKWGEPSYITKNGSTLRMDWKEKTPDQVAVYFKCTSKLVSTFKVVYKNKFNFEANRAIVFKLNENIPEKELKHCMEMALTYHKIKNLTLLGA
jgi:hypothetical protein